MRRWWASALVAAPVACSLTTTLDGLSDGRAEGDASAEGATGGDGGAGALSECEKDASHLLCDDFDRAPLPGPWNGTQVSLGAISLDRSVARSAPSSLSVALFPGTGTTRPQAFLAKTFVVRPSRLTIAFDLRFDTIDDPTSTTPIAITTILLSAGSKYGINLVLVGTSLGLWELILGADGQGGTSAKHPLPNPAVVGDWRRYRIDLELGAMGLASVWRDDAQVASVVIRPSVLNGTPSIALGVSASGVPSPGVSAHFDNVVIDAR